MWEEKMKTEGMSEEMPKKENEMGKTAGMDEKEEGYFSEIRDREGESKTSTKENLENLGGTPKTEEYHSEISHTQETEPDVDDSSMTDYLNTDYEDDNL